MEKNAKNATFFHKERKRTQRTQHSFKKNGKNARTLRSFEKNGCPTLMGCWLGNSKKGIQLKKVVRNFSKRYKTRVKVMKFEDNVQNCNKNIRKYETKHCFAVSQNNTKHFFSYFRIFVNFVKRSKLGETVTGFVQFRVSWK